MQRTKTPLGEKPQSIEADLQRLQVLKLSDTLWNYGYYGFEKINTKS